MQLIDSELVVDGDKAFGAVVPYGLQALKRRAMH
jgi:hypothetical protein